ncbi:SPRY domain containing protein [Tritrichomonas foetus]|uniref:SPRY domain containing protein n=1 Tax=Tritrichomonas foetus TaxID=1144522 RepID=A0A1J4JM30_9EUKA|nr:SPRY domain containing protein [Tritrichomonas foetus]|eukprot:OHS98619.1 SPRY domain containing protein [Tritrichomonas foetus]
MIWLCELNIYTLKNRISNGPNTYSNIITFRRLNNTFTIIFTIYSTLRSMKSSGNNFMTEPTPAPQTKVPFIMKLKFEELGVYRRAALGLLPKVNDPEIKMPMTFSSYKSSRKYKFLNPEKSMVTLEGGYRLCRSTRFLRTDKNYYWEVDFTSAKNEESHVRFGIATIEADMEAPVGVDQNGYCVGDLGKCIHNGWKNKNFNSPTFHAGDTVGFGFMPGPNGISLRLFLNGADYGVVYDNISTEKRWTPAISIYREAVATGRFIRPFRFDPGPAWTAAGDIPRDRSEYPISAKKLVKVMKGSGYPLEASEREAYLSAIDIALTPAHLMPI